MWRRTSAVGVAVVMLIWASAASADTTYTVTWRDTTFEKITSRFGISRDELFGANPGKIRAMCYGVGEIHQTSWGRTRAKCWRMIPYPVAGDVLNIPSTRAAMNQQNQSMRQERDGLTAERDQLRRQFEAEHRLRTAAEGELAQARAQNQYLAAAIGRLQAKAARSTSSAVALGSAATAVAVVLLAFIILYRARVRTGKVSRSAASREEEADAALRGIREQERLLSSRELKAKDRDADLEAKLGKAERDAQTAGRRLAEAEVQRVAMDVRERGLRAREGELEQALLRHDAVLARCKEEAEASARELAAMRIETELRDIDKERQALESARLAMRQEIEAGLRQEYDGREQRIQVTMSLLEGVDQERLRVEAERTELQELRQSAERRDAILERRAKDLDERQQAVSRREDSLAAYDSLVSQGFVPPQIEPPKKRPTLPVMSAVSALPREAANGEPAGESDLEREKTRVRTAPMMTLGSAPAEPEPTPRDIPLGDNIFASSDLVGNGDIFAEFEQVPETSTVRCRRPGCGQVLESGEMFVHRAVHAETAVDQEGPAAEILETVVPADEAQGGNGSDPSGDAREEVTRRVQLPGMSEYEPGCTVATDDGLLTCECGAGRIPEEKWEEHKKPGSHLRCTYCSPAVIIQRMHRARHLKRAHPEVVDQNPLSARRRSRPPKESSGSGE